MICLCLYNRGRQGLKRCSTVLSQCLYPSLINGRMSLALQYKSTPYNVLGFTLKLVNNMLFTEFEQNLIYLMSYYKKFIHRLSILSAMFTSSLNHQRKHFFGFYPPLYILSLIQSIIMKYEANQTELQPLSNARVKFVFVSYFQG